MRLLARARPPVRRARASLGELLPAVLEGLHDPGVRLIARMCPPVQRGDALARASSRSAGGSARPGRAGFLSYGRVCGRRAPRAAKILPIKVAFIRLLACVASHVLLKSAGLGVHLAAVVAFVQFCGRVRLRRCVHCDIQSGGRALLTVRCTSKSARSFEVRIILDALAVFAK